MTLPEDFEHQTWAKLLDAIQAVYCMKRGQYSEEELYQVGKAKRRSGLILSVCAHRLCVRAPVAGRPKLVWPESRREFVWSTGE